MTTTLDAYLAERMRSLEISQSELCRRAGISRQTLHTLNSMPHKLPSLPTVMAIAGALQVHPIRLLQIICDQQASSPNGTQARQLRGDRSAFVRDVSFPDGQLVLPGQRFVKTWELQNVGYMAWQGRLLRCMDEEVVVYSRSGEILRLAQPLQPAVLQVPVPDTQPGKTVQLSVEFTAPNSPGTVLSYWKMVFADGALCYPAARGVWVKVLVTALAAAGVEH